MPSSVLAEVVLDYVQAEKELDEYKKWLDSNVEFTETSVVNELKTKVNLCLLIQFAAGKGHPNRYKREFNIQGAFRADLVVGSTAEKHFVLVEFEGGTRNSIFNQSRGSSQLRDWSTEFEHGFSQVADWTWAKNDNQHSTLYRNAFDLDQFSESYVVVCGRTGLLNAPEKSRLNWRSENTTIASRPIRFWTYDDLYRNTSATLDAWRAVRAELGR
jgi:Domain of unknown function (DUF4263)